MAIALGCAAAGCGDLSPTIVIGRVGRDAGPIVVSPPSIDMGGRDASTPGGFVDVGSPLGPRVDLVLASVERVPPTAAPGVILELRFVAENLGRDVSPASYAEAILIPAESPISGREREAGTAAVPNLEPGASVELLLQLRVPAELDPGRYRVEVSLDPDDLIDEPLESNNSAFAGTLDVTTLEVSPLVLDFGAVGPGCSVERTVLARNLGPGRAVVDSAALLPEPNFELSSPTLPRSLAFGETLALSVRFAPQGTGTALSGLLLGHDQFIGPQSVLVVGEGQLSPLREDEWVQGFPEIDLLFVVQDGCVRSGCPLEAEQTALAAALPVFLQAASGIGAGWRILITTTSPDRQGQLEGPILTSTTVNLVTEFRDQIRAGTAGSPGGAGLAAATAVLESGRLRPEASVVVIVLALDDDRSGGTPAEWIARMRAVFDRRGAERLLLHGIVPPPPNGCSEAIGPAERYASASALTGGALSTICDVDDYDVLFRLGGPDFGLRDGFALFREPIAPETLSVEIDGRPVDSFDPVSGARRWRYEPSARTILFDAPGLPAPGAIIRIRYRSAC